MAKLLMVALVLATSVVALVQAQYWMKADGYDRDSCYKFNSNYADIYGDGPAVSCPECCHGLSMNPELLFDQETKRTYCACKAAEPIDVMDRTCAHLSTTEDGCGECCKQKKGKEWTSVKNIWGKDECRCKGPWVEAVEKKEEPKHHFLHKIFHHSSPVA